MKPSSSSSQAERTKGMPKTGSDTKRKFDSPLSLAAKRPSTSTIVSDSAHNIKERDQKKKSSEMGRKRRGCKAVRRNSYKSSLEDEEKEKKRKKMKAQVREMEAFVNDMRIQTDSDRRWLVETAATAQVLDALVALEREENKLHFSLILGAHLLADQIQFNVLSMP